MLLYNVSFPYTDLTNADLTGVQLYNSKLDGALNIAKAIMSEQLRENLKLIGVVIESSSATNTQVGQYPSQQVRQVTNNDFRKGYPIQ